MNLRYWFIAPRRHYGILILIVCIGLLFRAGPIAEGLWRDEASTYFDSSVPDLPSVLQQVVHSELNPPLYFILAHVWTRLVGTSDVAFKALSVLFGSTGVILAFWLGKILRGSRVGLLSALLAAVSPPLIGYSHIARPYSLVMCLSLLSLIAFTISRKTSSTTVRILFSLSITALVMTQYTGLFLAVSLFFVECWFSKVMRPAKAFMYLLSIFGLPLFVSAAWTLHIYSRGHPVYAGLSGLPWIAETGFKDYPVVFLKGIYACLPFSGLPFQYQLNFLFTVLVLIGIGSTNIVRKIKTFQRTSTNIAFPCYSLTFISLCEVPLNMPERYMIGFSILALPVLAYYLIEGWEAGTKWNWVSRISTVTLISMMLAVDFAITRIEENKRLSGAFQIIRRVPEIRSSYILVAPDYLAPTVAFYADQKKSRIFGCPKWDTPYLFSPVDYSKFWKDENAISACIQRIRRLKQGGIRYLAFITGPISGPMDRTDFSLPYYKTRMLESELERTHSIARRYDLGGLIEPIRVTIFSLHENR